MDIYEVKVGRWEPMVFDNVYEALSEASGFKAEGRKVEVRRRRYMNGARLGTKRLSVAQYDGLVRRLMKQCKAMGATTIKVVTIRRTASSVEENDEGTFFKASDVPSVAAMLTEYEPSSELVIDDSSYSPKFYDVFHTMAAYAIKDKYSEWSLLYETPRPDPQPHMMDY